jgi:hypothetical protein
MAAIGVAVAYRMVRVTGDRAVMVFVPPAFAVFGGVHVHFQQLVVAFPAMLYVLARYPRVRVLAGTGMSLAMIPWNVIGVSLLAGLAPLLVGAFCALTIGRRAGMTLGLAAAAIVLAIFAFAYAGFGPAEAHPLAHVYPPGALAETSWGDFSHAALMRPSPLMQLLRIPTLLGMALGLTSIACARR